MSPKIPDAAPATAPPPPQEETITDAYVVYGDLGVPDINQAAGLYLQMIGLSMHLAQSVLRKGGEKKKNLSVRR